MYINSSSGALLMAQGREVTAPAPADNSRSFNEVLKEVAGQHQPRRSPPGAISHEAAKDNIMRIARADPAEAAALAYSYAHNSLSGELLDCSDRPNIRYSATGELVTPETSAYFARTHLAMQRERTELYRTEMLKGTPPVKILEKIFDFNESMPTRFLEMAGW